MSRPDRPLAPRKRPSQARSRRTVEWILEGAARVFRREGFDATTNRIATEAGVSVGTLYEYFPNKAALLAALAERLVEEAERGIHAALDAAGATPKLVESLQAAVLASHRFPSQAIELVADPRLGDDLRQRAQALEARVVDALVERARAAALPEPETRGRAAFAVAIALASRTLFTVEDPDAQAALARHLLEMACRHLEPPRAVRP